MNQSFFVEFRKGSLLSKYKPQIESAITRASYGTELSEIESFFLTEGVEPDKVPNLIRLVKFEVSQTLKES